MTDKKPLTPEEFEDLFAVEGKLLPDSQPVSIESPSFAREVSRRYNESLWGKGPADIPVADPVIKKVENALEERRILNSLILKAAWKDLFFNATVFIVQFCITLWVSMFSTSPWAIGFCWLGAVIWGLFAINSTRTLVRQRRRIRKTGGVQ